MTSSGLPPPPGVDQYGPQSVPGAVGGGAIDCTLMPMLGAVTWPLLELSVPISELAGPVDLETYPVAVWPPVSANWFDVSAVPMDPLAMHPGYRPT